MKEFLDNINPVFNTLLEWIKILIGIETPTPQTSIFFWIIRFLFIILGIRIGIKVFKK